MPQPSRHRLKLATIDGNAEPRDPLSDPGPQAPSAFARVLPSPPVMRFFGVPFLKGPAREVTAIHLCPERVHLASIRDGWDLEVANRLTLQPLDLGDLGNARLIAFRPRAGALGVNELAIVGPLDKEEIARCDVRTGRLLEGLTLTGVTALAYGPDGRFVAAGDRDGRIRVWLLGPEHALQVMDARFDAQVESLAFHPEHPTVYGILASGRLAEVSLAPSPAASAADALRERAPGVAFSDIAAGSRGFPIYLAGDDERVYVVDTISGDVGAFAPKVGPITGLQVLPTSGHLCVRGRRSVYLLPAVGPTQREHLALVCPFEAPVYAAWELGKDALLVFHAAEADVPA